MLSVLRLTCVLKKLQLADLAKLLILQTTESITALSHVEQQFQRLCHHHKFVPSTDPSYPSHVLAPGRCGITISSECCGSQLTEVTDCIKNYSESDCQSDQGKSVNMSESETIESAASESRQSPNLCLNGETGKSSGAPCFTSSLADILKFLELVGNLKHTKRTGWVLRNVKDCESISGHMYRMSIMTFLLDGTEGLNRTKCMELALVHDLAESLVGDITPFCGISKEEKKLKEQKAMEDICKLIEPRGKRIMELFLEYEASESPESKFVKDLDRLDMVLQAFEYEKRDNCITKHQEFFDSTDGKFDHPFVVKLVNEIYTQRMALAEEKGIPIVQSNGYNTNDDDHDHGTQNGDINNISQKNINTS